MVSRAAALVLASLFVVSAASPAWAHCLGWSSSVADRHACCRGAMASEPRATACCAMSDQSDDTGPIEARVTTAPVQIVRHVSPAFTVAMPAAAMVVHAALTPARSSTAVPLYLRQISLLI